MHRIVWFTLMILVNSIPACAGGIAAGPGPFNQAFDGFLTFVVTGGTGQGYAMPVLIAHTDVYPGDTASASLQVGRRFTSAYGKCFGSCGISNTFGNRSGRRFVPNAKLTSAAPLYSPSISVLGQGVVGANSNAGFEHGVLTTQKADSGAIGCISVRCPD